MAWKVATRLLVFAYPIDINHIGICDINSFSDVAESGGRYNLYLKYRERNRKGRREKREKNGRGEKERGGEGGCAYSGCIVCAAPDVFLPFIFFNYSNGVSNERSYRLGWVSNGTEDTFSFVYGEIHTSIYIGWPPSRLPSVAFSLTAVEFDRLWYGVQEKLSKWNALKPVPLEKLREASALLLSERLYTRR